MPAIGIDVGGTWIRTGVVDPTGRVLARRRRRTDPVRTVEELVECLALAIHELLAEHDDDGADAMSIGVALPGIVDSAAGLNRCVNLPFLEGADIVGTLASRFDAKVSAMTDADAATWGEYCALSSQPERFIHLRLGTGVACGVVADNKLLNTSGDRSTHWDALVGSAGREARPCRCGLRGCLEAIASGPALEKSAEAIGCRDGLAGLQRLWSKGDAHAALIVREAADAIGVVIDNLRQRFTPQVISVGGGVADRLPCLMEQVGSNRPDADLPRDAVVIPEIRSARLGDDAGVVGAALLALRSSNRDVRHGSC